MLSSENVPSRVESYARAAGFPATKQGAKTFDRYGVFAFSLYSGLSFCFFGRGLIGRWQTAHIGAGADPQLMMWFLVWWPHAIRHHLNIFLTHLIWAPNGYNLTWQTSIPLVSVIAAPLTAAFGPVATLNILCLMSVALAGWSGFLLCRYLSGSYWPAIIGGYIFGFSPYMLGQLYFTHLHTLLIFPVPLAVYFALRHFHGEITSRRLTILLCVLLIVQFLISLEIFATMLLFAGIVLALALITTEVEMRRRVLALCCCLAAACAATIVIVSPYLYYFFVHRLQGGPLWPARGLSGDLLNFFVPSPNNQLGQIAVVDRFTAPFNGGNPAECDAYMALPLMLIFVAYLRRHWDEKRTRFLFDLFVIFVALSLGPSLVVHGRPTRIGMPGAILGLPILDNAAPVRFCLYAFLLLAIVYALWSASSGANNYAKILIAAAVVVFTLPTVSVKYWIRQQSNPEFFRTTEYRRYLTRNETVLFLPFWPYNDSMFWQAETGMYFKMAQGAGPWFGEFQFWPIINAFSNQAYVPDPQVQLGAYLSDHHVQAVIVPDRFRARWAPLLASLDRNPLRTGGISLYRVPARLQQEATMTLRQARERFDFSRFQNLLISAEILLAEEMRISGISIANAVAAGAIPKDKLLGPGMVFPTTRCGTSNCRPSPFVRDGLWLLPFDRTHIGLGIEAWHQSAEALLRKYRPLASQGAFVIPSWRRAKSKDEYVGTLLMIFDRQQLGRAARLAIASTEGPSADLRSWPPN